LSSVFPLFPYTTLFRSGSGPSGDFAPGENQTSVPAGAFNPFNPFNQILSGASRARLAEFGNRVEDNTSDAFLATVGAKGDKLLEDRKSTRLNSSHSQIS